MISVQDKIKAAAAYLDKYSEYKDWRTRVDADELDMHSTYRCVIGQIYGDYSTGKQILREATSYSEWDNLDNAFGNHTSQWRTYLTAQADGYTDKTFTMTGTQEKAKVNHIFTVDGVRHIVYAFPGESFQIRTEDAFTKAFHMPPVYVDGRVYVSKDRKHVLIYSAKGNEFFKITGNSSFSPVTHGGVHYIEQTYGPLSEVSSNLDVIHGQVQGTLHVSYGK